MYWRINILFLGRPHSETICSGFALKVAKSVYLVSPSKVELEWMTNSRKKKHKSWPIDGSKKLQEQNEPKEEKENLLEPKAKNHEVSLQCH